jgi:phenylalanyl-tRNA synthetase beta chain
MELSVQWLQEWLDSPVEAQTLADAFTMSGLEVESLTPAAGEFHGVVVGEIETEAMHPDAKRLHCCQVNIGAVQPLSIVCGGVNVRPGLKVAVATVGAHLPGGIEIKPTVLRAQPSHGMICSARELGLGEDKEGCILELPANAPIGKDLREYLSLNDQILDIALTANRGDCLSISGMAREAAALLKITQRPLPEPSIKTDIPDLLRIELAAPAQCPRYVGRIIRNIRATQTPVWMKERLRRSGIRSIHPVVDVTNYVMLELGQPLHAFDLSAISGGIQVRRAKPGETLTLLDERSLKLQPEDLVIADQRQPLALAGVMGGLSSAVTADSRDIFLESAFFTAVPLSLTARRHGLQTDASYRFARGVDFNLAQKAINRATQLLLEITGGQAGPLIEEISAAHLPKPALILLRRAQIPRLLGITLTDQQVTQILESLGMTLMPKPEGWQVQAPSYRYDITLEVDLIEELGRFHGYHHIPAQTMNTLMRIVPQPENQILSSRLFHLLVDRGYCEAITYSFVSPRLQEILDPQHLPLVLTNPTSTDMSVMRTSLWPGLLQALQYNQNRQMPRVRLFETGLCFFSQLEQIPMLGGVASGRAYPEQWGISSRLVDFFDVKGDIEALLTLTGQRHRYTWRPAHHPALHPGQSAALFYDETRIGYVGALHPEAVQRMDIIAPVIVFELKLDIIKMKQLNEFKNISKFPTVRRDLSVMVPQTVAAADIEKYILEKTGKLLNNVQIFDIYRGESIESGYQSIALGLIFQGDSRTLTDDEIQVVVDDLIKSLENKFNGKLR